MSYDIITGNDKIIGLPAVLWDGALCGGGASSELWSDDEVQIGIYNDKPLYQKLFHSKLPDRTNEWVDVEDISSLNIGELLSITGHMNWPNQRMWQIPLNYGHVTFIAITTTNGKKYLSAYLSEDYATCKNYPCVIHIIYTKTTDTG